jgi:hypothetical protein
MMVETDGREIVSNFFLNFIIWLAKFRWLRDEHGNELIENVRSTHLLHDRVFMYRPQSNPSSPLLSLPDLISAIEFPLE